MTLEGCAGGGEIAHQGTDIHRWHNTEAPHHPHHQQCMCIPPPTCPGQKLNPGDVFQHHTWPARITAQVSQRQVLNVEAIALKAHHQLHHPHNDLQARQDQAGRCCIPQHQQPVNQAVARVQDVALAVLAGCRDGPTALAATTHPASPSRVQPSLQHLLQQLWRVGHAGCHPVLLQPWLCCHQRDACRVQHHMLHSVQTCQSSSPPVQQVQAQRGQLRCKLPESAPQCSLHMCLVHSPWLIREGDKHAAPYVSRLHGLRLTIRAVLPQQLQDRPEPHVHLCGHRQHQQIAVAGVW